MKAPVYTKKGNKRGEVVLNPEIFAARINVRLLELVKNAYSANLRHGTASTKTRKEVSGGGKKPWRQKGTGRARHGSTRSPIWKGGGVVFGPHPRSYFVNLPKTMRKQALVSALSLKGDQKNVLLLEDVKLESAKTKEWVEIVKALPLEGKKTLCVVKNIETNLERASRNLSSVVEIQRASDLNAYHILQHEKLLIEEDAVAEIEKRLSGSSKSQTSQEASGEEKSSKKDAKPRAKVAKKSPVKPAREKTQAKKAAPKKREKK